MLMNLFITIRIWKFNINVSFNAKAGVTRGLHAEPWNKFISTASGSVFGAWCDLRKGESFGKTFSMELNPGTAVYVPKGVANGFQAIDDNISYIYLVDAHWSPEADYKNVNLFDPALGIDWPISESEAILSEKDKNLPLLKDLNRYLSSLSAKTKTTSEESILDSSLLFSGVKATNLGSSSDPTFLIKKLFIEILNN